MISCFLKENEKGYIKVLTRTSGNESYFFTKIGFEHISRTMKCFLNTIDINFKSISYLGSIYVNKEFRRQGEGSKFINDFLLTAGEFSELVFLICYKSPFSGDCGLDLFYLKNGFSTVLMDGNVCIMVNNKNKIKVLSLLSINEVCLCD